jgi:pimeloyl-ACP methyl ester carboxylesterase
MTQKHTIILIHGIRTHANWYQLVQEVFADIEGVEIEPVKYGKFDLLRFLIPGPWRNDPIKKSENKILPIIQESRSANRIVSVISHSNGTYVVSKLLKNSPLFKIDNLIMCGSIIDADYDWNLVSHKVSGKIINDYGVKDIWPAVAKSFTWGFGHSGTHGFGSPVKDRMHNTTHSAYFEKEFMTEYWKSFFETGKIVNPRYYSDDLPNSPWWFSIFDIPWRWAILFSFIAIPFTIFYHPSTGSTPASSVLEGQNPTNFASEIIADAVPPPVIKLNAAPRSESQDPTILPSAPFTSVDNIPVIKPPEIVPSIDPQISFYCGNPETSDEKKLTVKFNSFAKLDDSTNRASSEPVQFNINHSSVGSTVVLIDKNRVGGCVAQIDRQHIITRGWMKFIGSYTNNYEDLGLKINWIEDNLSLDTKTISDRMLAYRITSNQDHVANVTVVFWIEYKISRQK